MNCQDITRLIDTPDFHALTDVERHEAEAHAESCRHCAPLWFAHSRLAAARVPPMPAELSVRCLTLAAAPAQARAPRHASRRIMVIAGGLVVLAAAAAMLTSNLIGGNSSPRPQTTSVIPQVMKPEASPAPDLEAASEEPTPEDAAAPAAPPASKPATAGLPLLPAPISADQERTARDYLVYRKVIELYPQLVEGPELPNGQVYVVSIALRTDGKLLRNEMEIAPEDKVQQVSNRFGEAIMGITGSATYTGSGKGRELLPGRKLRGTLALQFSVTSGDFEMAKSASSVQAIVREHHADLILPVSREGLNILTVLLSEDGKIQNEHIERLRPEELMNRQRPRGDDAADLAKDIAGKLGMSTDELGLVGFTYIAEDPKPASGSSDAASPPERARALVIQYAWPRRATESAPTTFQSGVSARNQGVDVKAATTIVEHLMPEAFNMKDYSANTGRPTLVLTSEGEVIRTDYVKSTDMPLQMQKLSPGRVTMTSRSVELVNSTGQTAEVTLLWQYTQAQKDAMDKARQAMSAR
jgi:hypothetical protein